MGTESQVPTEDTQISTNTLNEYYRLGRVTTPPKDRDPPEGSDMLDSIVLRPQLAIEQYTEASREAVPGGRMEIPMAISRLQRNQSRGESFQP